MRTKWIIFGLLGKGLVSSGLKFFALSLARIPALKALAGAHQDNLLSSFCEVLRSVHYILR
jgi:hypothetical protein